MDTIWCLFPTNLSQEESRVLRAIDHVYQSTADVRVFVMSNVFEAELVATKKPPTLIIFQGITCKYKQTRDYPYIKEVAEVQNGITVISHDFTSVWSDWLLRMKLRIFRLLPRDMQPLLDA